MRSELDLERIDLSWEGDLEIEAERALNGQEVALAVGDELRRDSMPRVVSAWQGLDIRD